MSDQPQESVDLNLDEEKVEAWDEVKSDYQVEPGGEPVPNAMDEEELTPSEEDDAERQEAEGESSAR